ncbi:S1 family peptidase [Calycomorphotria hydatis]|nr:serine protease [Calycomorphotria hydatis]
MLNSFPKTVLAVAVVATAFVTSQADVALADANVYKTTLKSTAWIIGKTEKGLTTGSGVLVDKERKLVLTNYHVTGDSRSAVVFFPDSKKGTVVADRQHYLDNLKTLGIKGRVISIDRKRDLAMIELTRLPYGVEAIKVAKDSVSPGEDVHSVGNAGATGALWSYTSGTVRAVYKKSFKTKVGPHEFMVVETQNPINSGDSGGPLVNEAGELAGISQAMSPKARLVSYNVDISEVKGFLSEELRPAPRPVPELLERANLEFEKLEAGFYSVEFKKDEDDKDDAEKQVVFVTSEVEYYEKADVRKVWSLAYQTQEELSSEMVMKLLTQNARTKIGAWSIEKTEEGMTLVLFVIKLDAMAVPETLSSAMEYAGKLAVQMGEELAKAATQPKQEAATLDDWLGGK